MKVSFVPAVLAIACVFLSSCGSDNIATETVVDDTIVGFTTVPLDASKPVVRGGEAVLGNLIADALYNYAVAHGEQIDAAFINGGNIRFEQSVRADGVYAAGDFSKAQVREVLPFLNTGVIVTMTGEALLSTLERSVHFLPIPQDSNGSGAFLQVSSQVQFEIDLTRQAQDLNELSEPVTIAVEGQRVVTATVDGLPVDLLSTYRVLMPDFIARGGDGFVRLGEVSDNNKVDLSFTIADSLEAYFRSHSPVTPVIEGRIVKSR